MPLLLPCASGAKMTISPYARVVLMSLGEVCKPVLLVIFAAMVSAAGAKEVEKVKFDDEMALGAQKLALNGAGLRTKRKLGINWRVYVAGLYLGKKSDDAKAILASDEPKYLRLVF